LTGKILLLSDLHVGSKYGLWPSGMVQKDARTKEVTPLPQNAVNLAIEAHWNKMLAQIKTDPPDVVILNGDLIEGDQHREHGRGLMTNQISIQVKACVKIIKTIRKIVPKAPFYFTAGTDYHQMPDGENADIFIAEQFHAEFGDELVVEECGVRLFCRHTIGISNSAWQYMATAPGRDHMLLYLNKGPEKYGKIDIAVFSHRHQSAGVLFPSGMAIVTPCWQSKTPFAVKKGIVGTPDIGWIMLRITSPKCIAVDTSGIATVVRPCKIVGRDGKR
jgi:hypothetical protein